MTIQKSRLPHRKHLQVQPPIASLLTRRIHEKGYIRQVLKTDSSHISPPHILSLNSIRPISIFKSILGFAIISLVCALMLAYVGTGFGGQDSTATFPPNPKIITLLQFLVTTIGFIVMRKPMTSFTESWAFMRRELDWGVNPARSIHAQILFDAPWILAFPPFIIISTQYIEEIFLNSQAISIHLMLQLAVLGIAFSFSCYTIGMLIAVVLVEKDRVLMHIVVTLIGLTITTGVIVPLNDDSIVADLMWISPARHFISGAAGTLDHERLIGFVYDPAFSPSILSPFMQIASLLTIGAVAYAISALRINHTINNY